MLTYAVAVASAGGAVPPPTLAMLREADGPELPFHPRDHLFWANPSGSVAFAAWQDTPEDSGIGSHWHKEDRCLTAFTGLLWPRDRPWPIDRPWAAQLADHLRARPLEEGTDDLLGVFTAVSLDDDGRGVVASDPLGIGLLYMGENRAVSVLSTRANLAARLLAAESAAPPRRDAVGACWLAYSPYPIGSRTGFEAVEVVPAEDRVEIDPERGACLRRTMPPPWLDRPPGGDRQTLVEELRSDIATSIRAALALPVPDHVADLTGGKDSRLILGVMLGEGLAHEFEFRTSGPPDLPDVVVAKQIAETFGLRHAAKVIDPKALASRAAHDAALRDAGYRTVPEREMVMRLTVGSWSGMRNVCEPRLAAPPDGDSVLLSGLCGETLRTNYPGAARLRSVQELEQFPRTHLNFGAAGILRPEAEQQYDREVRRALVDGFTERDVPQDAVDAFYIRNRLRRWFGTSEEVDPRNRVFPLYSLAGVRAAFAIGADDRHAEWLHFEVIAQACESLLRVPFDKGCWDERLLSAHASDGLTHQRAAAGGAGRPARRPVGSRAPPGRGRGVVREWRRRHESTDIEIMRRYLLGDRSNPVFDVIDRHAVEEALGRFAELTEPAKRQLYGALTAAMWLGGSELTLPVHAT